MAVEMECLVCEADIPLDNDEDHGDIVQCSYCKEYFKLIRTQEKGLILIEEFEE